MNRLIFTTLDRAASDVIPAIANESEQASLTGCCMLLQLKPGSHKHAVKAENVSYVHNYGSMRPNDDRHHGLILNDAIPPPILET